jgi:hypothetical protein
MALIGIALAALSSGAQAFPSASGMVTRVTAPGATCMAVSDRLNMLVVGQRAATNFHLSVYWLDGKGFPSLAQPIRIGLPKPAALQACANYPLGLAFHPGQSLLYAWQDITGPAAGSPQETAAYAEFDHLLVLATTNNTLTPAAAFGRGSDFAYGQDYGRLAVPGDGARLFLPNMRDASGGSAVGYYDLDAGGMPAPSPVPVQGSLDGRGVNQFDMQVRAVSARVAEYRPFPTGLGFSAPTRRTLIFSGYYGFGAWDTENRRAAFSYVSVPNMPWHTAVGGDPDVPAVFGAGLNGTAVFRVEQADGFLCSPAQTQTVAEARFQSPPLVMPGAPHRLAIGGVNALHIVPLDADFRLTGASETIPVASAAVRALAWSPRHRRLYVAVDTMP